MVADESFAGRQEPFQRRDRRACRRGMTVVAWIRFWHLRFMFPEPIGAMFHLRPAGAVYGLRTPAEPMPPPIKEPTGPPENRDAPVREPEPEGPPQI